MHVTATTDAEAFATAAGPVLARSPVMNNVIATNLDSVLAGRVDYDDALWFTLHESDGSDGGRDEVVGVAMHTPPFPLLVGPVPAESQAAAAVCLVDAYLAAGRSPAGVNGPTATAEAFARQWQRSTGESYTLVMSQLIYEVVDLVAPQGVAGTPRPAGQGDVPLVVEWLGAFHHEVDETQLLPDQARVFEHRVAAGDVVLWTDAGRPVSLACASSSAAGVARIGPVYTPARDRRHGYAAAATAAATRLGIDRGAQRCMLYTDAGNPTSNSVYQRLGYTRIGDAVRFMPDGGSGRREWSGELPGRPSAGR